MRILGMFLIGFGIFGLIASAFAFSHFAGRGELLGWAICVGLIPVPMIVAGIWMVRRVEDTKQSNEFLSTNGKGENVNPADDDASATVGGFLDNIRAFELNRLNWLGWMLFFATFGFVLAICILGGFVALGTGWNPRVLAYVAALPLLLLAVGFFRALKFLFGVLGMSIYRHNIGRANAGPTSRST